VFDTLHGLARRGLGGPAAGGRQYVSWIHDADFARAVRVLVEDESFSGPVNLSSPNPLPYADFMRVLRDGRFGLPTTRWMLELGAFVMRTETELVLKSRRVVPGRLLRSGFAFEFPEWAPAARDLVSRRG
jgi:NAD dependent epimerase/dehydratase family enzyme